MTALTDVDIASAALVHLGRDPIAAFDQAKNISATVLQATYGKTRDAVLREYPWNFAIQHVALTSTPLDPAMFGYSHEADLPDGVGEGATPYCLRVWKLENEAIKWKIVGRKMKLSAEGPVTVSYIGRITDVSQYDPLFIEYLEYRLAMAIIGRVPSSEDKQRQPRIERMMDAVRRRAWRTDAMEQSPDALGTGTWLQARRTA